MQMKEAIGLIGQVVEYVPRQDKVRIIGIVGCENKNLIGAYPGIDTGIRPKEVVVEYLDENLQPNHSTRCYHYDPAYLQKIVPVAKLELRNGTSITVVFDSGECICLKVVNYYLGADSKNAQYCGLIEEETYKVFSKSYLHRTVTTVSLKERIENQWGYKKQCGCVEALVIE